MSFTTISSIQLVIIGGVIIAFIISDDRSAAELNVLGNWIIAIGTIILIIAAQKELIKKKCEEKITKDDIKRQIDELQEKYNRLIHLKIIKTP